MIKSSELTVNLQLIRLVDMGYLMKEKPTADREPVSDTVIRNKRQMTEMLRNGELGNTTRTWTPFDYIQNDFFDTVALRSLTPGRKLYPWNTWQEACCLISKLMDSGEISDYYVQEVMDAQRYVLAGEFGTVNGRLVLEYTTVKAMMRDAFAQERIHVEEAGARCILKTVCDPDDYEDLMLLVDKFPEHIVEFTVLDCYAGILKRRMMIWEVRKY